MRELVNLAVNKYIDIADITEIRWNERMSGTQSFWDRKDRNGGGVAFCIKLAVKSKY